MSASRRIRSVRALLIALICAMGVALTATPAHAADTVSGGRLDWGVKKSFQTYVTGPIAKGSWTLVDGAGTVGDSQFRFHSATGTYDNGSGAFTARYSGGVRFQGHPNDDGTFEMDLTIANPTVELSGGAGMLYVDIITRHGGGENRRNGVAFATLGVSGLDTSGAGTSLALFDVPVTLTAEGADSFEGYYSAGTALDAMNFSGDIKAAPTKKDKDDGKKSTKDGEFAGAIVDWGVKRTWREFVAGDIAQGGWELADGAADGGALFRFGDGSGRYDATKKTLTAAFIGGVHFEGTDVDVAFADFAVDIADGEGVLTATVTVDGETVEDAEIVTFDAPDLEPVDGLILLDQVPAILAEGGADALGGFYQPGAAMDPITIAVPLDEDATVPPLPDLGSDPQPTPSAVDEADPEIVERGTPWPFIVILAVGTGVGVLALVLIWRGRRHRAADQDDEPGSSMKDGGVDGRAVDGDSATEDGRADSDGASNKGDSSDGDGASTEDVESPVDAAPDSPRPTDRQ